MAPRPNLVAIEVDDVNAPVLKTRVRFPALDGLELGGTFYCPRDLVRADCAVVFNCGGGIAAANYRRFASYLAENGIPVLTYDYRGIGASRPQQLRGFCAMVEDWAEYDCGGAIAWLSAHFPHAELVGIAHSVGALLLGGAPNAGELSRFVLICSHTGYFGDYRLLYRIPMALVWHVLMPGLTRLFGYFPARRLRLGEDLPSGIALQWAARRTPELQLARTSESMRAIASLARCKALSGPALVVSFTDDAFATEAGTRRLLSNYPKLRPIWMRIKPSDVGADRIGHFGFFRSAAREALWPRVLAYILRKSPLLDEPLERMALQ
jgi:predicted alpha/beta hydrolase